MTMTDTAPPTGTSQADQSARALLNSTLHSYGLDSLGSLVWQWDLQGRPPEQIMLDIRDTPEYQQRFPAMQALAKQGHAMTEQAYMDYEKQATQVMRAAGMPPGFYDNPADFASLISGQVSISELNQRVQDAYVRVINAPPEVRAAYGQFFGDGGDQALAATFLDDQKALPVLERQTAAAEFAGAGSRFGYSIDLGTATQAAQQGVTASQAQSGFGQVQQLNPIFNETVSETNDLSAEKQGVGAVFGLDATSQAQILQRQAERTAAFAGSTDAGGAKSSKGLGLGIANRTG